MTLQELLPYITVALALLTFFLGRISVSKDEGKRDGAMLTEIGYVKSGIDDIKRWQREQEQQSIDILSRLSAVEQSAKQAHHRIDEIREHCCGD